VDIESDQFAIQGIAIEADGNPFDYRVRWPDMTWSDWATAPVFAGTRGRSIELTGIAIRLREPAGQDHSLRVIGRFAGRDGLIRKAGGDDCTSETNAPLCGFQIILERL
jgi:hypothetical protein